MELFGTAGIRGPVRTDVTPARALAVGSALAADGAEFVVGRDGRETGTALVDALAAGLQSGGATVRRVGQVPTPALAYASQGRRGVMVTASHNPPADNGIKCFVDGEEYDREAEQRIADRVETGTEPVAWEEWRDATDVNVLDTYREAVVSYATEFGAPLDGLPVAVDCGNGVGSVATPQVLTELGADVVALNANVDGHFPGRESMPTPETLADLRRFVADGDAAFGIGHDGDADRIVLVDGDGEVVHEDTVLAVLAEQYVRGSDAADPVVVTTPNASGRIDERVETAGGRVERVRLGALHEGIARVRAAGDERTAVAFAAEPWKHIHPAFGGWIDGVTSAAVLARLIAAEGLGALRSPVTERPYRKESVPCPDDRKQAVMSELERTLPDRFPAASASTEYGVRLTFPDAAWLLVRPSGTEPYVRVYAESDEVESLVAEVVNAVETAVGE
jgi:phosphomannomutase